MRISFGDVCSFLIVLLVFILAIAIPEIMALVALVWFVFVTTHLVYSGFATKSQVFQIILLWCIFNIPTVIMGLIVWWRW